MNLIESLALEPGEIISLVGGGGKTTLMFALAHELVEAGYRVITTTTTKIYEPTPHDTPLTLLMGKNPLVSESLRKEIDKYKHITVAWERLPAEKLRGISPELIVKMDALKLAPYIIVEADGAKHHSLKAPNTTEPVIPGNTSLVIAVVGIDSLGKTLTEEFVFRPEIASGLLGLPLGSPVTPEVIATLITHPQGITKGSPPHARIIPFINKMDLESNSNRGSELARAILKRNHPQIERVFLGQANSATSPVTEVISR